MRRERSNGTPQKDPNDRSSVPLAASSPSGLNGIEQKKAVPGRPRRKAPKSKRGSKHSSFWHRFYMRWFQDLATSFSSLLLAVVLWYSLGVISIGSSKFLLMNHEGSPLGGVPPLFLTLQQLGIGSTLLRFLLHVRFMGTAGLQPWPKSGSTSPRRIHPYGKQPAQPKFDLGAFQPSLLLAGVFFSMGFLATNYGFSGSSAAFVETIKAAEPITSATVAVWWGIEVLSREEVTSLGTIVAGVVLSTLGNGGDQTGQTTVYESVKACTIVMASNLCFSFRGLHQKLFRATPEGSNQVMDDLNLQFRMQQIGAVSLVIPVLIFDLPSIIQNLWHISMHEGLIASGAMWRYLALSVVNGCAFTSYNLASTYILSRISVVHHAALNCIRRIFAIVVTSMAFGIPITLVGALGIFLSFIGFMSFTHYKVQRQRQPKPLSPLLPVSAVN